MANIKIEFKGFITVDPENIILIDKNGDWIDEETVSIMTPKEIVDGLKDGTYTIDLLSCYEEAIQGEESYEFSVSDL